MWWALLLGVIIGALAVVAFVLVAMRSAGPFREGGQINKATPMEMEAARPLRPGEVWIQKENRHD